MWAITSTAYVNNNPAKMSKVLLEPQGGGVEVRQPKKNVRGVAQGLVS